MNFYFIHKMKVSTFNPKKVGVAQPAGNLDDLEKIHSAWQQKQEEFENNL
jgi:hypothetical protein